jgi:hypothetical protein
MNKAQKIINKISFGWLFKENKQQYPPEFAIVIYNKTAINNGVEDNPNKLIVRYKYNEKVEKLEPFRVYGYSDSLFQTLKHKLKIPIYDQTLKEIKFPIFSEINLDEIRYIK